MGLFSDLRFAGRSLRSTPLFSAIAVASLALGIGANTAIFSVVESASLRQLPYSQPDRLVVMFDHQPLFERASLAPGEFLDYQKQTKTLSGMAAYSSQRLTLTGQGEPRPLSAVAVTPNFFEVLGAHPARGRLFAANLNKSDVKHRADYLGSSTATRPFLLGLLSAFAARHEVARLIGECRSFGRAESIP